MSALSDPLADTLPTPIEWCVDTGDSLLVMTCSELSIGVDSGALTPTMRIWREGMARWATIADLLALESES